MRKSKQLRALGCAAAAVLGMSAAAQAALFIYEPFDYATSNTSQQAAASATLIVPTLTATDNGNGPGVGLYDTSGGTNQYWNAAGPANGTPHQILTAGLTAPAGYPTATGNAASLANADFTQMARMNLPGATGTSSDWAAGKTYYYSLLLNVADLTALTITHTNVSANNDLIAALNGSIGVSTGKATTWSGELVMKLGSTAGTYDLGVRSSTPTTAGSTFFSGDLSPNTTHLVVVRMTEGATQGSQTNDLWIDPTSFGGDAPNPDGTSMGTLVAGNDHVGSIVIGAGIVAGAAATDTRIDELRVGDTWADVTSSSAVPEPASIGMLSLAGLALLRRRRKC